MIDKTGTLTEGKPNVVAVDSAEGIDENELLRLAASVERGSEHPLAQAILKPPKARELGSAEVRDFAVACRQGRDRNGRRQGGRARQRDA